MTNIYIPVDDAGTKSLIKQNTTQTAVAMVTPVTADPKEQHKTAVKAVKDGEKRNNSEHSSQSAPRQAAEPIVSKRRQNNRRIAERRQKNSPVLLDTRSGHDRRSGPGQRDEDKTLETNTSFGIDVIA